MSSNSSDPAAGRTIPGVVINGQPAHARAGESILTVARSNGVSIPTLCHLEGLSDVGINLLRYNAAADVLLIAYTNSNLDLYQPSDGSVINLPFIFKNALAVLVVNLNWLSLEPCVTTPKRCLT